MTTDAQLEALRLRVSPNEDTAATSALPVDSSPSVDFVRFASEYGLDASFVHLVTALALNDREFWREAADSLSIEADTRAVARNWVIWLWSDPEIGLRRRVKNAALLDLGDAICSLHRRAGSREAIPRAEWRKARAAVAGIQASDVLEMAASAGMAASSWDFDAVPAAAADMLYPWKQVLFAEVDRSLDWTEEKEAANNERFERVREAGMASADAEARSSLGQGSGDADEEALKRERAQEFAQAYERGTKAFIEANPSDLDRRGELRAAAWSEVYRLGREGFLSQLRRGTGASA